MGWVAELRRAIVPANPIVPCSEVAREFAMFRSGLILSAQILPGVLLILLGWGFDDVSGFVSNRARGGLLVVGLAGVVCAVRWGLELQPLRRGLMPAGKQSWQLAALLFLSLILLWFLPFADRRRILTLARNEGQNYWRYLGLLLSGVGVTVRVAALRALGEHFSAYVTLQPNHRLVQQGIYRRIRHPLYLSLLLAPTGIALVFASYLALPIFILAVVFVLDRIRKEEQLLAAHFGAEFEDYRRRVWKIVPLVF
jgi:protein-S-isoprenylcysteine O-methyltransferase Ste14